MSATLSDDWLIQCMMMPHSYNLKLTTALQTAVNDEMAHSYGYIEPQSTVHTSQFKAANTPVTMDAKETDFYDTEQHTYEEVNA